MLSKLRFMGKVSRQCEMFGFEKKLRVYSDSIISTPNPTNTHVEAPPVDIPNDDHSKKPMIVDINIDDMMYDDPELERAMRLPPSEHGQPDGATIKNTDLSGAPIAPVDVNPWIDEQELAEGTVDYENIERMRKQPTEYPPPPEKRGNSFKCKGIQIRLPQQMISNNGTYRYRLDEEDKDLPDDMHICKF